MLRNLSQLFNVGYLDYKREYLDNNVSLDVLNISLGGTWVILHQLVKADIHNMLEMELYDETTREARRSNGRVD